MDEFDNMTPPGDSDAQEASGDVSAEAHTRRTRSERSGESQDKHSALVVTLIVVIVLIATALGVGWYVLSVQEQSKQELAAEADEHLVAAGKAVDQIDEGWEEFALSKSEETSEAFESGVQSTSALVTTARTELDMSAHAIDQLPESEYKTEYLAAIGLSRESLDAYEQLFTGMGDTMEISRRLAELGDEMDVSRTALNEAVEQIDNGRYSDGGEKAARAQNSYETVAELYLELAEEHPDSEADKLAAIAQKNAVQAGYAVEMAEQGRIGSVSEFNAYVDKYAAVNDEIRELPLPSWAVDVTLLTAESTALLEEATAKRDEALAAYDRAQEAFAAGEY